MEKTALCICRNKEADQFRRKMISADVFTARILQSLNFLNPLAISCGCTTWLMLDLVVNPKDRFSHGKAKIIQLVPFSNNLRMKSILAISSVYLSLKGFFCLCVDVTETFLIRME